MTEIQLQIPVPASSAERSYWLQEAGAAPATPPLSGTHEADIAIIGGGFCGLWTALRLREADPELRIAVLEADHCGAGASGRNGGQVHSWFAEIDLLERVVGAEEALSLCTATAEAIGELEALQAAGTIDMQLRLDGWYWTASSKAQEGAWDGAMDGCRARGTMPFETLDAARIAAGTGSDVSYAGIAETRAGTVHPGRLALGLRDLALARGIAIHERSPVTAIAPGRPLAVKTAAGSVTAPKVALCTNAWAASLPELARYMYVVESQVIATEPAAGTLDAMGWSDGKSICDSQANVLYYQRTTDGRVIFGRGSGHIAYANRIGSSFNRSPERGRGNVRELARVYPGLAGVPVAHDWSGPIDCTAEHLPVFGESRATPGLFYGAGFNGTGIAQTPVGARILASLLLGRDDRWSRSGLVGLETRTALPPEPLRYLGARIVRSAIRRRNDLEIAGREPSRLLRAVSDLKPGR
ncbi:FAD-binding oxidoreductase [Mangrovicoccus sp. HB161399]|uniref:NAD(P)/FAD-dependent oxidoreductase n=1 Tax=Mangrovicoccus sp. HB161399 TaxID=2720392 RepID=UPI0015534674|nr:FAD-binding oxidoreductase [Mangrovicoccus sp. HB161399]